MNEALQQIQSGLVSYIGAIQEATPFKGKAKNQIVVGILMDEVLKTSQTKVNQPCDLYILIPLFKANIIILKQQIQLLSQQNVTEEIKEKFLQYPAIIEVFQNLISRNSKES